MRLVNKILFGLVGIVLMGFALYQISLWFFIPGLSDWAHTIDNSQQVVLPYVWLVILVLIGLVGLSLLLLGIFRPITQKQLVITNTTGKLEIPEAILAKNLQYALVEQFGLVEPKVDIKLLRSQRAKVKVRANVNDEQNIEHLATAINQYLSEYLQDRLDITAVKPVAQLSPLNRNKRVTVV